MAETSEPEFIEVIEEVLDSQTAIAMAVGGIIVGAALVWFYLQYRDNQVAPIEMVDVPEPTVETAVPTPMPTAPEWMGGS